MKRFSVRSSLHRLVHRLHENLPTFSSTLFLRQFGKCSYSSLNELFRIYLPSITALWVSLKYKHRNRDSFLLFTFDYTFKCGGVVVIFTNLPCNVFFQLLDQGRGMLFSIEMCAQSCAKVINSTEMCHVNFFTSVT